MKRAISILIPCYNAARFLPDLFEGIKLQTIPFAEVICYDDNSTDNTIEVAENLGAKVIRGEKNRGPSYARNRLIEASTSNWIHFHDADDLINTRFVEIAQSYITNDNTQFLCNTYVFDRVERTKSLGDIKYNNLNETKDQLEYFLNNVGFASMGLYSKNALISISGFREDLKANEDPDLHVRLVKAGFTVKCIPEYLVTKLEHETSYSHQNWMQCIEDKLTCYEFYLNNFDKKYYNTIGRHIVISGAYFFTHNNIRAGNKAIRLAKQAGITTINTSKFAHYFSLLFGINLYYRFLNVRQKFH